MEKKLKTLQSVLLWGGLLAYLLVFFVFGDYFVVAVIGATIALAAFAVLLGTEIASHQKPTSLCALSCYLITSALMSIIIIVSVL